MDDNNKYVTHQELANSTEKILHHIDNRSNELKLSINDVKHEAKSANWKANWILGILAAIIAGVFVYALTKGF